MANNEREPRGTGSSQEYPTGVSSAEELHALVLSGTIGGFPVVSTTEPTGSDSLQKSKSGPILIDIPR